MSKWFVGQNKKKPIVIKRVPDGTRIIVTSDQQVPFHDDPLLNTIYFEFAKDFKPKTEGAEYHNFFNGDFLDLYSLSRFPANVTKKFTLADEIELGIDRLSRWKKYFTHNHLVFGNHEARWDKRAYEDNPETAEFNRPLDEVLQLDALGYDWVPYQKHYDFMGFIITHGDRTVKYAAAAQYDEYHKSGTSGHVNRPQSYTFANAATGEPDTWYCTGMTCIKNIGDYIKEWGRLQPWQQAFLIGEVQGGVLHVELIRVHHGGFWANGKMYRVGGA